MDRALLPALIETIDAALEARVPRSRPVTPWLGWLVVVLLRQRERQAWHRFIVNTRLRDQEKEGGGGIVPGLTGWKYSFHGRGCCLTGPDGEAIDVDRRDEVARVIDPYFFAWRVRTLASLRFPEMRLWRWMPSGDLIVASLPLLVEAGAIEYQDGGHWFCLAPPLEDRVAALKECAFEDAATQARWRSALGDSDDEQTREAHRRWVRERALDPAHAYKVLEPALAFLEQSELLQVCLHHLSGPVGPAMGKALETLGACAEDATGPVMALLGRISPGEDAPYSACQALQYLLERGVDDGRMVEHFRRFSSVEKAAGFLGNPFLGTYATLALRFLPDLAMGLVRRALRSTTPMCVDEVAGLLALIDQPWCVRELSSALEASPGSSTIAEALRRTSSELAIRWAARQYVAPAHDPSRLGFTWEEVHHNSAGLLLDERQEQVRPLAEQLRRRYPPTWQG